MVDEAGLSVAVDFLAVEGGIWLSSSGLGDHLVARLANVDITFEEEPAGGQSGS